MIAPALLYGSRPCLSHEKTMAQNPSDFIRVLSLVLKAIVEWGFTDFLWFIDVGDTVTMPCDADCAARGYGIVLV
ncbi:MAG: hypothetical protein GXP08_09160 [Gammaproteobacteria bacterium]|nr:hypothetical protein [Gammaproteobacteria bacterium]